MIMMIMMMIKLSCMVYAVYAVQIWSGVTITIRIGFKHKLNALMKLEELKLKSIVGQCYNQVNETRKCIVLLPQSAPQSLGL